MGRLGRLRHRFEWGPFGAGAYYLREVWWNKMVRFTPPSRSRRAMRRDQLLVAAFVFGTLLAGMVFLWAVMFGVILLASYFLPAEVVSGWAGVETGALPRLRYGVFLATIGMLAAALGGNLEEEDAIKAELFFDEEV